MEIEDRIANTELVVSAGRGGSYSVMIPRLAGRYSVDAEVGVLQKGKAYYVLVWHEWKQERGRIRESRYHRNYGNR